MTADTHLPLAVFDFDGTIISGDSLPVFLLKMCGGSRLRLLSKLMLSPWGIFRALPRGKGAVKEAIIKAVLSGRTPEQVQETALAMIPELDTMVRPEMPGLISTLQGAGVKVVIVTASATAWVEPWGRSHGIEVIGTELGADPWRFITPNCKGEEKIRRLLERFPQARDGRFSSYADSPSDRPLMALSASPHWIR